MLKRSQNYMMDDGRLDNRMLRKRKPATSDVPGALISHNKLMKLQNPAVILEDCKHMLPLSRNDSNLCKVQNDMQDVSLSRVRRNSPRIKPRIPLKSLADSMPVHKMPEHSINSDALIKKIPLKTTTVNLSAGKTSDTLTSPNISQIYAPNVVIVKPTPSNISMHPKNARKVVQHTPDCSHSSNISTTTITKINRELTASVSSTVSTSRKTPEVTRPTISVCDEGSGSQTIKSILNQTKIIAGSNSNNSVANKAKIKNKTPLSAILPQATTVCNAMKLYNSNMRRSYEMSDKDRKNHSSNIKDLHKSGLGYASIIGTKDKKRELVAPHSLKAERDGITLCLKWLYSDCDSCIDGFVIMESKDGITWTTCKTVGKSMRSASFTYFLNQEQNNWYIGVCTYKDNRLSRRAVFFLGALSHPPTMSDDDVKTLSLDLTGKTYKTYACYSYDKDVMTYHCHTGKDYESSTSNNGAVGSSSSGMRLTPCTFYKIICSPVYCSPLPPKRNSRKDAQIINYHFSIDQTLSSIILASREKVFDNDKYRVLVRMCEVKNSTEPQGDQIPDCIISVNARVALVQMVDKVCGSLDITDKCKFTRYCTSQNALKIEWMPDNKSYCITISVVEMLDTEGVLSKLMQNIQPASVTAKMVKNELQSYNGSDISSTSMKTQLICPLGKSRLVTPCRGSLCKHVYCMDALTLLKLNETRPLSKKKCFMCNQPLEYLYVDGFFLEILQTVPETVNEVEFQLDGSWSYTPLNDDNDNDGDKRVFLEPKAYGLPVKYIKDDSGSSTMFDNKDGSESLLTTQLEKVKLQLHRLSNLDKNPIVDDFDDEVSADTSVDIADNTENVDIIDLTRRTESADCFDKDDKSGILDSLIDLPDVVPTTDKSVCNQTVNNEKTKSCTRKKILQKAHSLDKNDDFGKLVDKDKSISSPLLGLESENVSIPRAVEGFEEKRDDHDALKDKDVEIVSVSYKKHKPRNEKAAESDPVFKQKVELEILRLLEQTKNSEKDSAFHEDIKDKNAKFYYDASVSVSKQATKRKRIHEMDDVPTTEKNIHENTNLKKKSLVTLHHLCHLLNESNEASKNSGPRQTFKKVSDNDTDTNADKVTGGKRPSEQEVHVRKSNSLEVNEALSKENAENERTSVMRHSHQVQNNFKDAEHIGDTKGEDMGKDSAKFLYKVLDDQSLELRLQSKYDMEHDSEKDVVDRKESEEEMQLGMDKSLEIYVMNNETNVTDAKPELRYGKQIKQTYKDSGDTIEGCMANDIAKCDDIVTSEVGSNEKKFQITKKSARIIGKNVVIKGSRTNNLKTRANKSMINKNNADDEILSNIQTKKTGKEIERETVVHHVQDNTPTVSYTKRRSKRKVNSIKLNSGGSEDQLKHSAEKSVTEPESKHFVVTEVDYSDVEISSGTNSNHISENRQVCSSSPSDLTVSQSFDNESCIIHGTVDKISVIVNYDKYKAKKHWSGDKKRKSLPVIVPFIVDCNENEEVLVVSDSTKYQGKKLSKSFSESENVTNFVPYIVDCVTDPVEESNTTNTDDEFESVVESIDTFVTPSESPCKRDSSSANIQSGKSLKYFAKGKTNISDEFKPSPKSKKSHLNKNGKNLSADSLNVPESDAVESMQDETTESNNDLKRLDAINEKDKDMYADSDFHVEDLSESEVEAAKRRHGVRSKSLKLDFRTCLSNETTFHYQVLTSGFPYRRSKPKLAPTTKKRMKLFESGLWSDRETFSGRKKSDYKFWKVSGRELLSTKLKELFAASLPNSSTISAGGRHTSRQSSVESVNSDSVENEVGIECGVGSVCLQSKGENSDLQVIGNVTKRFGDKKESCSGPSSPNQPVDEDFKPANINTIHFKEEQNEDEIVPSIRKSSRQIAKKIQCETDMPCMLASCKKCYQHF